MLGFNRFELQAYVSCSSSVGAGRGRFTLEKVERGTVIRRLPIVNASEIWRASCDEPPSLSSSTCNAPLLLKPCAFQTSSKEELGVFRQRRVGNNSEGDDNAEQHAKRSDANIVHFACTHRYKLKPNRRVESPLFSRNQSARSVLTEETSTSLVFHHIPSFFFNHGREPENGKIGFCKSNDGKEDIFFALEDLERGDELLVDYVKWFVDFPAWFQELSRDLGLPTPRAFAQSLA